MVSQATLPLPPAPFTDTRKGLNRIVGWLRKAFLVPQMTAQGVHIDPIERAPPDPSLWSRDHREAWYSEEMELFRRCLCYRGLDVRNSVLDDLSTYYGFPPEECRQRCLHWEEWSVSEWKQRDRSSGEGLRAFYNETTSWSFDLLWYAYLQTSGFAFPASVIAARTALRHFPGGAHLDFGSGVGATSQLFHRLGFSTTAADVSKPLLDFARWRLERRGDHAAYIDLNAQSLPYGAYHIVTAIDSVFLAPDFDATVEALHRSLRPGGLLLTNFDVRPKGADESAWHLYDDELDLEYRLRRLGFVRRRLLGGIMLCCERVEPTGTAYRLRSARDKLVFKSKAGRILAIKRRIRWPTPKRVVRFLRRKAAALVTPQKDSGRSLA